MQTSKFKVENRNIKPITEVKLIGMAGQDKFNVEFIDSEWTGLHKTMKLIRSDGEIVHIAADMNEEFVLTQKCYKEGTAKLGFFGTASEDDPEEMKIASTDYIPIYFSPHAYVAGEEGIPSNQPTPTQWDIIIGQMNDIKVEVIKKAREVQEYVANVEYANIKGKPKTWADIVGAEVEE